MNKTLGMIGKIRPTNPIMNMRVIIIQNSVSISQKPLSHLIYNLIYLSIITSLLLFETNEAEYRLFYFSHIVKIG
jgi:hypothetical protein